MKMAVNDEFIRLDAGGKSVNNWITRDLTIDANKTNFPYSGNEITIG